MAEIDDEAQDWNPSLSSDIDYHIPFPGTAQDIQQWILDTSDKKQPAIAFSAALSVLSAAYGRQMSAFNGIKPNMQLLCIADSGDGKDWPIRAIKKIIGQCGMADRVVSQIASGKALTDCLEKTPSMLMLIDEFGHFLSGANGVRSNQYSRELIPMMTELYSCASDAYLPKVSVTGGGRRDPIIEPHLCVMGLATERQFIDTVKTGDVLDGSLARYNVLFGDRHVEFNHEVKPRETVPDAIVSKILEQRMLYSPPIGRNNTIIEPSGRVSDEFRFYKDKSVAHAKHDAKYGAMYNRLAVKSVQMAMLIDGLKNVDVLEWCHDIVIRSGEVLRKKLEHNAADNEIQRQNKAIIAAIKESGREGISRSDLTRKTLQVTVKTRNDLLRELIDSGLVFTRDIRVDKSRKSSTLYFWRK